jgi:phage terminase large subunit
MKVNAAVYEPLRTGTKKTVVHQGGSSSGKTYGILQWLFQTGAEKPGIVITVVGQDIPNLRVGAYRDAQNILASDEVLSKWYPSEFHNKSNRTFKCVNGSVIEFNSYSDSQDAKSGKRDVLFINEANGVSYEIYEQLRIRTTERIIIDFNPSASFWAHERLFHDPAVEWVVTTFRDNTFINDSVRDAILSYEPTPENIKRGTANEYRWKVYGLGEVGRLEGLVFPDFRVEPNYPDETKWRVFGMDFGYTNDPTTLIEIGLHAGELYWRELIYETGLTNPDISKELHALGFNKNELIIADSAEPKSIEELRRMGWNVKPAVKGADSIMNGIDMIKRYKVNVYAKSRNLIDEFSSYTWKKDRNGNAMNVPIDAHNHGIDAGRYALQYLLGDKIKATIKPRLIAL